MSGKQYFSKAFGRLQSAFTCSQGRNRDFSPFVTTFELPRSKLAILVKNIPYQTEADDLKRLFGKFGNLSRVCVPPSKTMALVEYIDQTDAQKGFRSLAYKKFKHVPLYLEWAPQDVFVSPPKAPLSGVEAKRLAPSEGQEEEPADTQGDALDSTTVFVKNLNFSTTAETIRKVFEAIGPVRTATIARKREGGKSDGKWLSMGYGFVEYKNAGDCEKAIKSLQSKQVDGHNIQLKLSNKKNSEENSSAGKRKRDEGAKKVSTKIIVKNLAFEATAKDIRELFSTFGQIKRCRVPRKFDGSHRGFAFVDFVTLQEAQNAFEALSGSHLYGRHLVLQWAKEDESLADIREKTIQKFSGEAYSSGAATGEEVEHDEDMPAKPRKKSKKPRTKL